jgi:capsular exopolysaccharide synthesis family protein
MSRNFELMQKLDNRVTRQEILVPRAYQADRGRLPYRPGQEAPEDHFDIRRLLQILSKNWKVSAFFAASVLALTIVATFLVTPTYEPVARVEVDPPGAELFSMEGGRSGPSSAEYLETQSQNLQNDQWLAVDVIRALHLENNPDLITTPWTSSVLGALLRPFRILSKVLNGSSGGDESLHENTNAPRLTPQESNALSQFNSRLKVKRDTASHLVNVSFAAHNPQLAARVTNTLVERFIEKTYKTRNDAIQQSSQWLEKQLDQTRANMEASNRALADFQKATGIVAINENDNTYTQQLGDLSHQLAQAQGERIQAESYLRNKGQSGRADALPQVGGNPVVQALTQRLAEARSQLAFTQVVYGVNHPSTKQLQHQVDELEAQVAAQRKSVVAELNTAWAAARSRERSLTSQMQSSSQGLSQVAEYVALKKDAEANSNLYNSLYAKVKESAIMAASTSGNIRVIDQARVLTEPSKPNWLMNLGVGSLLAIFGGVMLAFLKEATDNSIQTIDDIRDSTGLSNIAIVPSIENGSNRELPWRRVSKLLTHRDGNAESVGNFALDRPLSPEAEALRGLHTALMFSNNGRPPQTMLVVSSFAEEGKTTVATNLAITFAHHGRTCLVDGDLRKGRIARALGVRADIGLAQVLQGTATLHEALTKIEHVPALSVISAGAQGADAAPLVCSSLLEKVIAELRQEFDFVIVDSAPLLMYSDARLMSTLVDGVILVGRSGLVNGDAITRSIELLAELRSAPIVQVVLNAADRNALGYSKYKYAYDQGYRPAAP